MVDPVGGEGEDELREGPESPGQAEDGQQTVPDYQWTSQLKCRPEHIWPSVISIKTKAQ